MRKWIAEYLFLLAARIDTVTVGILSFEVVRIVAEEAGKRHAPKKRGRPLGSKNKPKVKS